MLVASSMLVLATSTMPCYAVLCSTHLKVHWFQRHQSSGAAGRRGVAEGPHALSGRPVDVNDPTVDPRNGRALIGRGRSG